MIERKPILVPRKSIPTIENPYGYIYITTNLVNGKKYCGQHRCNARNKSYLGSGTILLKAIDKYGRENFVSEPIDWAKDKDELDKKEICWINFLGAVENKNWYNVSYGGESGPGLYGKLNYWYGKPCINFTEDVRNKMSLSAKKHIGNKNNFFGKKHTEYWKEKFRNGSNNPMARAVYQYSTDEKFVRKFSYLKEVEEYTYNSEIVGDRCRLKVHGEFKNRRIPYKDYLWSYLPPIDNKIPSVQLEEFYQSDYIAQESNKNTVTEEARRKLSVANSGANNPSHRAVVQLTLSGEFVQWFQYIEQVKTAGFRCPADVGECCRGRKKFYKGFKWMYKEDWEKLNS